MSHSLAYVALLPFTCCFARPAGSAAPPKSVSMIPAEKQIVNANKHTPSWLRRPATPHVALQPGEHILREGEELATNAKFYMVESGTVECLRAFEVGRVPGGARSYLFKAPNMWPPVGQGGCLAERG